MERSRFQERFRSAVPFLLLFAVMLLLHSRIISNFRDDEVNREMLNSFSSIPAALAALRQSQSSRTLIDGTLLLMLRLPTAVFKVCDALIYALCAFGLSRIFRDGSRRTDWFCILAVALFPASQMFACGWITTSVVYLWPLAALLLSLTWYPAALRDKRVCKRRYLLLTLTTVFAATLEQCAALFIGFSVLLLAWEWFTRHKFHWFAVVQIGISIALLTQALLAPGNAARTHAQVVANMPDFYHKTLFQKLSQLFVYTNQEYLLGSNLAVTVLCALCCWMIWKKYQEPLCRAVGTFPLTVVLALGPCKSMLGSFFPALMLDYTFGTYNITQLYNYVTPVLSVAVWGCILLSVLLALGRLRGVVGAVILCAGLTARMIMAFTPSYMASGWRTSLFLYFAVLCVCILLFQTMYRDESFHPDAAVGITGAAAVVNLIAFGLSI